MFNAMLHVTLKYTVQKIVFKFNYNLFQLKKEGLKINTKVIVIFIITIVNYTINKIVQKFKLNALYITFHEEITAYDFYFIIILMLHDYFDLDSIQTLQ